MERLGEQWMALKPESKVNLAINMVDAIVLVCAGNEKLEKRGMTDQELISRLRNRFRRTNSSKGDPKATGLNHLGK